MCCYDDEDRSISERIARRASIDIQTYLESVLPEVKELRVQLQQADQLDKARYVEIVKLKACIVRLEDECNTALSRVYVVDKEHLSRVTLTEAVDKCVEDERSLADRTIVALQTVVRKLQLRLSNCAHWSNPMIYANPVNALVLINDEACDAR